MNRFKLAGFTGIGYEKGRSPAVQVLWMLCSGALVTRWWCPASARRTLLKLFGAEIAPGVLIRHRVRVHWPWKLSVGADSWIGEDVWILNLEPVRIGADSCISQGVMLCTGSHDRQSATFEFDNGPIVIGDAVWIAARATILRGVTVGDGATVGATALVHRDVDAGSVVLAPQARTTLRADPATDGRGAP